MATIPGRKRRRFYEKKAFVEAFSVVPPIVAAAVAARISVADPARRALGWFLAGAAGWLMAASFVKVLHAHAQDGEQKQQQEYGGLQGALHVLYAVVGRRMGLEGPADGKLRVTIHRVVPPARKGQGAEELEQLLPYVGGSGREAGRTFSIRSGIIGKAVREKSSFAGSRRSEDHESFISELVRDWSYTEDDARKLSPDRRSWMAVPIFGAKPSVVGVVFLDSSEHGVFSADVQQLVIDACGGIATYIKEAY